jgi:hypothetical protein
MRFKVDNWEFEVFLSETMEYSAAEAADHCDCAYCRNFYQAADSFTPQLRQFLAQFGLDLEAPDELMPYDVKDEVWYDGVYAVCGRIIQKGHTPIQLDDLQIIVLPDNQYQINHGCPDPCFFLSFTALKLPWVLDESMYGVISPANDPSFFRKMIDRFYAGDHDRGHCN